MITFTLKIKLFWYCSFQMEFSDIFPKHKRYITSVLSKYIDLKDYDDLLQEILIHIAKKCHTIAEPQKLHAWLYRVIYNKLADYFRKRYRQPKEILFTEYQYGKTEYENLEEQNNIEDHIADPHTPDSLFIRQNTIDNIMESIASIPEPFQNSLYTRDVLGLSYADIARIEKVEIGTTKSRVFRARRLFRERYQAYGGNSQ